MSEEKYVHGYRVTYEKDAEEGIYHLNNHLDPEYAKVFFVYAQHYRTAPLEDQSGRKYLLTYEHDTFTLKRK